MSPVPEIALAASARDWPDRLHRFLLDHGGGRVRARVMGAEQAVTFDFDVLFIDDICSFLTPRLVSRLRDQGREIVGVFSPADGPDAKRRLLECGISDVVEIDATPEEFLRLASTTIAHRSAPRPQSAVDRDTGFRIGVRSAAAGVGCTEVAITVASHAARLGQVVLADLDQSHPGVAQRLDLPPHPNLRTAVDLAHNDPERLSDALHHMGGLAIVAGLAMSAVGSRLPDAEITALLEDLASDYPVLVLDMGDAADVTRSRLDLMIAVVEPSPVGITRLLRAVELGLADRAGEIVVAVNRFAGGARRGDDIKAELAAALPGVPSILLPEDRRIIRSCWDGTLDLHGPFGRSARRLTNVILEGASK